jgi:hypothetical protein
MIDTLRKRVSQFERMRRRENAQHVEWRPSFLERLFRRLTPHPMTCSLVLLVGATTTCFAATFLPPDLLSIFPANYQLADKVDYFSALWTTQVAFIALLYPIVISFVTILLGRPRTPSASLPIYLHMSGAQLSGYSAMTLVFFMTLQHALLPTTIATDRRVTVWIWVDGAWFLMNLAATFYFLSRTYAFLRPAMRARTSTQYLVDYAWPRQWRPIVATTIYRHALQSATAATDINTRPTDPTLIFGEIGRDAKSALDVSFRTKQVLVDVRIGLLSWAVKRWFSRARDVSNADPFGLALCLPVSFGHSYRGPAALALAPLACPLTRLECMAIRWSYVFRTSSSETALSLSVKDIVDEVQADAVQALAGDDASEFHASVRRLIELFEAMIATSQMTDPNGSKGSLLLVGDPDRMLGLSFSFRMRLSIEDLVDAACRHARPTSDYLALLVYTPERLFSVARRTLIFRLASEFIEIGSGIFLSLSRYWRVARETRGDELELLGPGSTLDQPSRSIHARSLERYVEGWESLLRSITAPADGSWTQLGFAGKCVGPWLSATAKMLSHASVSGDERAATVLHEVLMRAHWNLNRASDEMSRLRLPLDATSSLFWESWPVVSGQLRHLSNNVFGAPTEADIASHVERNLWTDICSITAFVNLKWAKTSRAQDPLCSRTAVKMIRGGADAIGRHVRAFTNAEELLLCVMRQRFANIRYTQKLDRQVEVLLEVAEAPMLSGRIRSRRDARDLSALEDEQLLTMIAVSPEGWEPSPTITTRLRTWIVHRPLSLLGFRELLGRWLRILETPALEHWEAQFRALRSADVPFEAALANARRALEAVRRITLEVHDAAVAAAPISSTRLERIEGLASASGFSKATGSFPLQVFADVGQRAASNEPLETFAITITNMDRGEFTEPRFAVEPANEDDFYGETVSEHVASFALDKALSLLSPRTVRAENEGEYLVHFSEFVKEATRIGLHPLLLLENPTIPEWVYEWGESRFGFPVRSLPDGLVITHEEPSPFAHYQFHLNGVPVVYAPIRQGRSLLVVAESFEELSFVHNALGHAVTAEAVPVPEDPVKIDLKLSWKGTIKVNKLLGALELRYVPAPDSASP